MWSSKNGGPISGRRKLSSLLSVFGFTSLGYRSNILTAQSLLLSETALEERYTLTTQLSKAVEETLLESVWKSICQSRYCQSIDYGGE
ncbi:hypothetical protein LINPERHAP2_LOCUS21014 [Linum perenne]